MSPTSYTLEMARNFSALAIGYRSTRDFGVVELSRALKTLAEANDRAAFKAIVDSYRRCAETLPESDPIRNASLSHLERLCAGMDHSFAKVDDKYRRTPLTLGNTQALFRELYGSHFNPDQFTMSA